MAGPPYYAGVRLFFLGEAHWALIDGEASFHGVDLTRLPLDRFCNAIYWWAVQRVEDRDKFDFQLEQSVGGRVTPATVDRELDDFASFMGAFGGDR